MREVHIRVWMKTQFFRYMALCLWVHSSRRLEGSQYLHISGQKYNRKLLENVLLNVGNYIPSDTTLHPRRIGTFVLTVI